MKLAFAIHLFLIIVFPFIPNKVFAQEPMPGERAHLGFELDALPYISGGYYGSVWIGYKQIRYRGVIAKATVPEFLLPDGFTNNEVRAYAAIADYFFQPDFRGWWLGTGFEYWRGEIQTELRLSTGNYHQTVFTLGGGYVWKFLRNLYLNPWIAGHARLSGESAITVDDKIFSPAAITPEFSIKIGWHF